MLNRKVSPIPQEKLPDESSDLEHIPALGTDASVPKYLRAKGKVRNKMLRKRETELLIRDIWRTKNKTEAAMPMEDYMFHYLKNKYGVAAVCTEVAYSLVEAAERYKVGQPLIELECFSTVICHYSPLKFLSVAVLKTRAHPSMTTTASCGCL